MSDKGDECDCEDCRTDPLFAAKVKAYKVLVQDILDEPGEVGVEFVTES